MKTVVIEVPVGPGVSQRLCDTVARAADVAHQAGDHALGDALHAIQKEIRRS